MYSEFIFVPLVGDKVCFFGILPTLLYHEFDFRQTGSLLVHCLICSEVTGREFNMSNSNMVLSVFELCLVSLGVVMD